MGTMKRNGGPRGSREMPLDHLKVVNSSWQILITDARVAIFSTLSIGIASQWVEEEILVNQLCKAGPWIATFIRLGRLLDPETQVKSIFTCQQKQVWLQCQSWLELRLVSWSKTLLRCIRNLGWFLEEDNSDSGSRTVYGNDSSLIRSVSVERRPIKL